MHCKRTKDHTRKKTPNECPPARSAPNPTQPTQSSHTTTTMRSSHPLPLPSPSIITLQSLIPSRPNPTELQSPLPATPTQKRKKIYHQCTNLHTFENRPWPLLSLINSGTSCADLYESASFCLSAGTWPVSSQSFDCGFHLCLYHNFISNHTPSTLVGGREGLTPQSPSP